MCLVQINMLGLSDVHYVCGLLDLAGADKNWTAGCNRETARFRNHQLSIRAPMHKHKLASVGLKITWLLAALVVGERGQAYLC